MIKNIVILSLILFTSCTGSKLMRDVSVESRFISFTKVKLKIKSSSYSDVTLKGYIYILKDSSICFKFYGPLAIELMSGIINSEFRLYDNFNKKLIEDLFLVVKQKSGIVIDFAVLQSLLIADQRQCRDVLSNLNRDEIQIDTFDISRNEFTVKSLKTNDNLSIKMTKRHLLPWKINILYKGQKDRYDISFEVLAISNEGKTCKFYIKD